MSSSQRKQMLQPWPLCLMFTNSKDRSILPRQYTRVPTISRSGGTNSSIVSECASNATLVTNASPFTSQTALSLSGDSGSSGCSKTNSKSLDQSRRSPSSRSSESPESDVHCSYYAGNLLNNQSLKKAAQIYNHHIRGEEDLNEPDYEQLNPLISRRQSDSPKMFSSQEFQVKMTAGPPFTSYFQAEGAPKKRATHYCNQVPGNSPKAICTFTQILAALSVSLGSLVVGFASSYTSPALPNMRLDGWLGITDQAASWIASIMPLSALFGGIAGGPMIEYLGRRNTILATGLPFIAAWLLIAFATHISMILIGRILSGFCVGVASLALPVYLGETIQPEVRGTLGLLPTALGNVGILVSFIVGKYLGWSELAILGACLPVPFIILMFLIPETPRWYIARGDKENARKSLQWLRGEKSDVNEEMAGIEKAHVESERNSSKGALKELLKRSYTKSLLISLGLMGFQQLSGINAVIFYTVEIFKDAGSTINDNDCTIIVGVVNFLSTFVATALIDRLGRKILLYISSVSMMMTLFTLGTFFYVKYLKYDVTSFGWIPLVSFVIYVIGFSVGFGPIPWLMMGEILPAKIRGSAASVVTGFNWSCTFVVTKTFKDIILAIGPYGTFWLFGCITLIGLVFVIIFVPETRGRSLEEIEMKLTGPVRRTSAVANIKPMPTAC